MKRLFLALLLVLAWAGKANAQGSFYRIGPFPQSGLAYVCPAPDGGTPCPSPSAIFSNATLTTAISNPINMPQGATVSFYIAGGQYTIQFPVSGYNQIVTIGSGGGITSVNSLPATPCIAGTTQSLTGSPGGVFQCGPDLLWHRAGGPANVIDPIAFGVKASGHSVADASITNTSNIITCPNADCKFLTTAKVGQTVFVGPGLGSTGGYALAETTIQSVDSDTQIHSVASATATQTGVANLVWGDIDEASNGTGPLQTALNAFVTSLGNGPTAFQLPCGIMLIEGGANNIVTPKFEPAWGGCGPNATVFIPTPNFNWSSCTPNNTCLFSGLVVSNSVGQPYMHDFSVYGVGATTNCPGPGGKAMLVPAGQSFLAMNLYVNSYCQNAANGLTGIGLGATSVYVNLQSDFFGTPCMSITLAGQPANLYQLFCGDVNQGLVVNGVGILNSYGGSYGSSSNGQGFVVNSAATVNSYGETISNTLNMGGAGGVFNANGDTFNCSNCGSGNGDVFFAAVAKVTLQNSTLNASGTTNNNITGNGGGNGSTVVSIVNNKYTPGTVGITSANINWAAPGHSIKGICTGVGTAASTLALRISGSGTAAGNTIPTTCTSTTLDAGFPVSGAVTLQNLVVTATAAGTNASSGVVTVLKNGVATTITCTIGTGTSCSDGLHSVSASDGELISIQFTTQAADTLAGVKAFVEYN